METTTTQLALKVLQADAKKIKQLLERPTNQLCIAQCKAFEEVVDTQMYGFSKQVDYAVRINAIDKKVGQQLLAELEREINQVYTEIYEEQKNGESDLGG